MNRTYLKYELLRLFRNRRAFFFSLAFPLALYLLIAAPNGNTLVTVGPYSLLFSVYYMVSMASYGAMIAALSGGGRIAAERATGWNRQLRITPLKVGTYFRTKVLTSYVMAGCSIALLYLAGVINGVHLESASRWVEMTALLLLGILPFVAMGIAIGHLLTPDSIGPVIGGGSALFGLLGGQWFPPPAEGALRDLGELVPSYWLTQASHIGIGGSSWPMKGWLVFASWTIAMTLLATWAYRRDTHRA